MAKPYVLITEKETLDVVDPLASQERLESSINDLLYGEVRVIELMLVCVSLYRFVPALWRQLFAIRFIHWVYQQYSDQPGKVLQGQEEERAKKMLSRIKSKMNDNKQ